MSVVGLRLDPLDVLFFRDGRPFGASARVQGGLPSPQTFAGAVRTALLQKYGCDFARLRGRSDFAAAVTDAFPGHAWIGGVRYRGPWLARGGDILVPAPAVLHGPKKGQQGGMVRLAPLREGELPGWRPDQPWGRRPLWARNRAVTEPVGGYLTRAGLEAFLRGEHVGKEDVVAEGELYDSDRRTGIEVDSDRLTAAESKIYGISFLALKEGAGLCGQVLLPPGAPPDALDGIGVLAFGGEGRRVRVAQQDVGTGLKEAAPSGKQKVLLLLTTPALCAGAGPPPGLSLAAAAVPQPQAVSGWDLARGGPRATRFALPAGSVFFLDDVPANLPESLSDRGGELGWGCYLKGVWTDA